MPAGTASRSGTERRKKTYLVTSRYDAEEFAELDAAASRTGLTRASYQRVQSLAKPRTRSVHRPPIEKELLARAVGQLGRVGGNLNQIARAANMGKDELWELNRVLAGLFEIMALLRKALGRAA